MRDDRGRRTAKGGRQTRTAIEPPLGLDGWDRVEFCEIHVGDLVALKLMVPFDAGDGTPRTINKPGQTFAPRAGVGIIARVVGDDLDHEGALLVERTRWSHHLDGRLIAPPILMSLSRRDLDRRGAWAYRHRDEGPADRSGRTGTAMLMDRLLRAAGGGADDEIVVDRLAGCTAPETTTSAKPRLLGRIRAAGMLRGEAAFSEAVCAQLLALPPIERPEPRIAEVHTKPNRRPASNVVVIDEATKELRRTVGPYAGVDAVLSLRFETRAIWGVLKAVLGVSETGCAIALDLYAEALTAGRWTSYSRSKRHYARLAGKRAKWQARDALYSADKVVGAVDDLQARGWIDHAKAFPGSLGWQSRMRATPALVEAIRGLVRSNRLTLTAYQPSAALVLRDAEGMPIPFKETAETKRMERNVERLNEGFRAIRVEGAFPSCVMRICNESLERGGRFYLEGGSVQVMPEEERLRVTWDGERSGEVDYKTMHVSMLYSDAGLVPPTDSYAIEGYPRDLVKVAVMAVINAPTYGSALGAIAHDDQIADIEVPGSGAAFVVAARLMDDLKRLHRPISSSFHSGAGAFLMRREADILEDVMLTMRKKGEVVLPIHDSGLARLGAVPTLEQVMVEAAEKAGLRSVRIETATAANDDIEAVGRDRTA